MYLFINEYVKFNGFSKAALFTLLMLCHCVFHCHWNKGDKEDKVRYENIYNLVTASQRLIGS